MNWADYSRFVGNVFGSLLAAEGVFAFFLEGGFLGLMLFGGNRLGPRLWLFSTSWSSFGAHFSALWILMANSWMQTPQGYEIVRIRHRPGRHDRLLAGRLHAVVHAPPPARLGGVVDGGVGADAQRQRVVPAEEAPRRAGPGRTSRLALPFFIVFAISNVAVFGASMAIEVTHNQPIKLASMEGLWQGTSCAPLYLVGWVDVATQTTSGISIPCLLSILAYSEPAGHVTGSTTSPASRRRRSPSCSRSIT